MASTAFGQSLDMPAPAIVAKLYVWTDGNVHAFLNDDYANGCGDSNQNRYAVFLDDPQYKVKTALLMLTYTTGKLVQLRYECQGGTARILAIRGQ